MARQVSLLHPHASSLAKMPLGTLRWQALIVTFPKEKRTNEWKLLLGLPRNENDLQVKSIYIVNTLYPKEASRFSAPQTAACLRVSPAKDHSSHLLCSPPTS